MEQRLRLVLINRSELEIEHRLDADVLFLLKSLYLYEVRLINLEEYQETGIKEVLDQNGFDAGEALYLGAVDAGLHEALEAGLPTIGFVNPQREGQRYEDADIIVEGFEEVDFYFLERIYQRKHGIPWRVIETERTYLREMTVEDVDELYEIYAGEGMTDYVDALYEDREEEISYTEAYIEHMYRYYGYGIWLVCDRYNDRVIGRAGLNNQMIEGNIELEMGYLIRKEYQRQGYALEVCQAVLDYAEKGLDFERVNCLVEEGNQISVRLLEKLGFLEEGSTDLSGKSMKRYVYFL